MLDRLPAPLPLHHVSPALLEPPRKGHTEPLGHRKGGRNVQKAPARSHHLVRTKHQGKGTSGRKYW